MNYKELRIQAEKIKLLQKDLRDAKYAPKKLENYIKISQAFANACIGFHLQHANTISKIELADLNQLIKAFLGEKERCSLEYTSLPKTPDKITFDFFYDHFKKNNQTIENFNSPKIIPAPNPPHEAKPISPLTPVARMTLTERLSECASRNINEIITDLTYLVRSPSMSNALDFIKKHPIFTTLTVAIIGGSVYLMWPQGAAGGPVLGGTPVLMSHGLNPSRVLESQFIPGGNLGLLIHALAGLSLVLYPLLTQTAPNPTPLETQAGPDQLRKILEVEAEVKDDPEDPIAWGFLSSRLHPNLNSAIEWFNTGKNYCANPSEQNYLRAWCCFQRAAELNHIPAMHELALLALNGLGIDVDLALADKWFERHRRAELANFTTLYLSSSAGLFSRLGNSLVGRAYEAVSYAVEVKWPGNPLPRLF